MEGKVFFILGFLAVVSWADKRPAPPAPYSYSAPQVSREYSDESTEAKYDFDWAVKDQYSGNDFGHQESRDGDHTQGSYYVQLPDGRLQTVTYYVDGDSGYVADVQYQGEARYPDSVESREYSAPRPSYSAPRPTYSAPRPTYSAPRPTYSAPDSEESNESGRPVYG
ncbi:cuticle protein 7-like [Macrobrachium nipponense]|uniref:cuticle protein 7-like n=1 Tax=Macrobrachium nipponense TaxID=159736 RepID=UPI0030C7B15C